MPNWWQRLFNLTPQGSGVIADNVKQFIAIEKPQQEAAKYANNPLGLSNEYKIGKADCESFLKYLQNANGPVVLCRVAVNDYECRELDVKATRTDENGKVKKVDIDDGKVWLARMNFYRDVDVTEVTFSRDGVLYTYEVIADPINMNGGLSVKNDPKEDTPFLDALRKWKNKFDDMADALALVLKIFMIVVVLFVAISLLLMLRRPKVKIKFKKKK